MTEQHRPGKGARLAHALWSESYAPREPREALDGVYDEFQSPDGRRFALAGRSLGTHLDGSWVCGVGDRHAPWAGEFGRPLRWLYSAEGIATFSGALRFLAGHYAFLPPSTAEVHEALSRALHAGFDVELLEMQGFHEDAGSWLLGITADELGLVMRGEYVRPGELRFAPLPRGEPWAWPERCR